MARWVARKKVRHTAKWRTVLCVVLIVLSTIAVLGGMLARYADTRFLNTKNYTETVSALPKQPTVATALGTFTADRLFNNGAVENQVAEFLPKPLAPAAPLLTGALQDEVASAATNIASSNAFQNTWTAANQAAHTALLAVAHSEQVHVSKPVQLTINLQGLFDKVRERFGSDDGAIFNPQQKTAAADLAVNVQQTADQLRKTVGMIETGSWLLPSLAFICTVAAIFVANNRRRAFLALGIVFVALGLSALGGFYIASNQLFGTFEQEVYRNAAQTIYEAFYSSLRVQLIGLTVFGLLSVVVALGMGPYAWAVKVRKVMHLPEPR